MKVLVFLLCWFSALAEADVLLQADKTSVMIDNSIQLIISSDDLSNNTPDLSPLNVNFTILGMEQSSNYTRINGQSSASMRWVVLVTPKKVGRLTIPPLTVGHDRTNSLIIEVKEAQASQSREGKKNDDVFIEVEIDNKKPYINEQIRYTVKMFTSKQLVNVAYQEPLIQDGLVISLGDSGVYQVNRHDKMYTVEEQRYAFFPQKSGLITIQPPAIHALIYDGFPSKIHLKGPLETLQVQPIPPKDPKKAWLPSPQTSLKETFDRPLANLSVGDTLVRTITMEVEGFPAQLLPDLPLPKSPGITLYPDKPELKNELSDGRLISHKIVKVTYLFNQDGTITIPKLSLPWFDTKKQTWDTATLPAISLSIAAKPVMQTSPNIIKKTIDMAPAGSTIQQKNHARPFFHTNLITVSIILLLGSGWIITLLLLWKKPQLPKTKRSNSPLKELKKACLAHNHKEAQAALLKWSQLNWPHHNILNIGELKDLVCDPEFTVELDNLIAILYHSNAQSGPWDGLRLWQCIETFRNKKTKKNLNTSVLPDL